MIVAGLLAIALAGQPVIVPTAERARVVYRVKKKRKERHPPAPPEGTRAEPYIITPPEPRRVRVIPIIDFGEFYRRVGL